jgi:hypothetical protein
MIIRATRKLLNISKINPPKDTMEPSDFFSGEWYANLVSLQQPGKLAIHLLHNLTYISIVIPGKSLNKAAEQLPNRVSSLLSRHGFINLIEDYKLNSEVEILSTKSRKMLGYLNSMKFDIEYQAIRYQTIDGIDYDRIEDIEMDYIFRDKNMKGYVSPRQILRNLKK